MTWPAFALLAVALGAGHVAGAACLPPAVAAACPDLLVWLVCPVVACGRPGEAALAGWCAGLVRDLAAPDPLGLHSLALGLAAACAGCVRPAIHVERPAGRAALAGIVAAGYVAIVWGARAAGGDASLCSLRDAGCAVAATAALAPWGVAALARLPCLRRLERRTRFGSAA